jgi:hypothetical protein
MEVGHAREFLRKVAVTADNAAAVTENADDTAVLPMGHLVPVRTLEDTEQIMRSIASLCGLLDLFYETRPRTLFQVVKHWCLHIFAHMEPPLRILLFLLNLSVIQNATHIRTTTLHVRNKVRPRTGLLLCSAVCLCRLPPSRFKHKCEFLTVRSKAGRES